MRYSYDPKKSAANLKKHGYDFEDAPQVIESDRTVTFEDHRFAYDGQRFITLGMLRENVVVIATAETKTRPSPRPTSTPAGWSCASESKAGQRCQRSALLSTSMLPWWNASRKWPASADIRRSLTRR
jgi:uncharacterized DUF497 family protein